MKTVLGVDLGGTKILIGEMSIDGKIYAQKKYDSVVISQRKAISRVQECIHDYLQSVPIHGEIQAIGMGLVGRIDRTKGDWIEIHPDLSELIHVRDEMNIAFHLPCYLGNDVYCATLAEKTYGMGKISQHFIYLNIGTGIAAGCVVNGNILEGLHFDAGEVGHMIVDIHSDVLCPCGNKGCVEVLASGLGLHNRALTLLKKYPNSCIQVPQTGRINALDLFAGYDSHDELCLEVMDEAFKAVATTIMNLIRMTDPEAIVLGGGIGSNDWFISHLQKYLNPKTTRFITKGIKKTCLMTDSIGFIGAAQLAINQIKKGDE